MYTPPFVITSDIVNLIAQISALMERYAIRLEQSDGLRLRKANRIRTIHSSLAIEGNQLTEGQVSDIINGKNVVAPIKEIQEVKNAIRTYELFPTLDPFKESDLLRAHAGMMEALADDAGCYRRGGVGVFSETGLVHMAPPACRVPQLMAELFDWLRVSRDHLLLRSCVFHYEFEFIHPFSDGNGRTGRLWQSLLLGRLHPLFHHLPVENIVYGNQQQYYDAIAESTARGESTPFITFMLGEILTTLREHQGEEKPVLQDKLQDKLPQLPSTAWLILEALMENPALTVAELTRRVDVKDRMVRNHLATLRNLGIIERHGSNKNGRWKILLDCV